MWISCWASLCATIYGSEGYVWRTVQTSTWPCSSATRRSWTVSPSLRQLIAPTQTALLWHRRTAPSSPTVLSKAVLKHFLCVQVHHCNIFNWTDNKHSNKWIMHMNAHIWKMQEMIVYQSYRTQKILLSLTAHAGLVMVSGKNAYTLIETSTKYWTSYSLVIYVLSSTSNLM